jgi:hypothetical protein
MARIASGGGFGLFVAVYAPFHLKFALLCVAVAFHAIRVCRVFGVTKEHEIG